MKAKSLRRQMKSQPKHGTKFDKEKKMAKTIAIIGGTGKEGKGLGFRWAKAGHKVIIGSRTLEKAEAAVSELKGLIDQDVDLSAALNDEAVRQAEVALSLIHIS